MNGGPETRQQQPAVEHSWPQLPAPQQPVCLDSIGELCASLRRGIIPLLRTGTLEARSSCAGLAHAQPRAASPPAVKEEVRVCQHAGAPSPRSITAVSEPLQYCSACADGTLGEKAQQFTGPALASPAGPELHDASEVQPLDSSPAAGESAHTAVTAPRSSCSSEAAMRAPRSPGDRTDSDDEGARRRRSPPDAAAPAGPASSAAAAGAEAAASAGESEAERQPSDGPRNDVGAAPGAADGGDDAADDSQRQRDSQQVCGLSCLCSGFFDAIAACRASARDDGGSRLPHACAVPQSNRQTYLTRGSPACNRSCWRKLCPAASTTARRWTRHGRRRPRAPCATCTAWSRLQRSRCELVMLPHLAHLDALSI